MTTPNHLADWIKNHAPSKAQFCRDSGICESHLSLFLRGKRGVSFRMAKRISDATNGAIPIETLVRERNDAPAEQARATA